MNWLKILIVIVCSSVSTFAQVDQLLEDIAIGMSGPDSNRVYLYEGTLESNHPLRVALVFNKNECQGFYEFVNSNIYFRFTGLIDSNSQMELRELDRNDQTTGYLLGKFNPENFKLTWQNINRLNQHELSLNAVEEFGDEIEGNVDRHLIKFKGSAYGSQISVLQNLKKNKISIKGSVYNDFVFDYKCESKGCMPFEAFQFPKSYNLRRFTMTPISEKQSMMTFMHSDGTKSYYRGNIENKIFEKHLTFADYRVLVDLEYPITDHFNFNQWMETYINKTQQELLDQVYDNILDDVGNIPEERYQFESYSWYNIDYLSKDLISGTITHTKSWSSETTTLSFIYDIQKETMLELDDIFKSSFDHLNYISSFLSNEKMKKSIDKVGSEELHWIKNATYENITISDEGLICHSDYSVIYGENKIVIPIDNLKKHLKNKSIKREFF